MENTLIYNHFNLSELRNISSLNKITELSDLINDIYYTNYTPSRNEELKNNILNLTKFIDDNLQQSNQLTKSEISFLYFTKSLCLDKLPEYSKQAEESASKSLKLNPFNSDNYNCIAHILWKKKDINSAINYFEKALEIDRKNTTTLRCLSMIVRSKEFNTIEEKQKAAKLSLDYAKEAITLDLKNTDSWYTYGNAYFYKAFVDSNQYDDLKCALGAYNKAESNQSLSEKTYKNPDLFYNRGIVHSYLEKYGEACQDFIRADAIDPNLKAKEIYDKIVECVNKTYKFIKNQGGTKPKKWAQMISKIPRNFETTLPQYTLCNINNLTSGNNQHKLISAKFIAPVPACFEVPISFICCDYDGNFFSVSLYNISKTIMEIVNFSSSCLVILEPNKVEISVENETNNITYPCVQVSNIKTLLIDGKFCTNFSSTSQLNSTFFN